MSYYKRGKKYLPLKLDENKILEDQFKDLFSNLVSLIKRKQNELMIYRFMIYIDIHLLRK